MDAVATELERVYASRYNGFRHAVVAIVGDYEQAHDVVQDGFARAFANRGRFRGGSLEAWVWTIVVRRALDLRRRRRPAPLGPEVNAAFVPEEADPELARALRALSPRRRLVVFLRYFADLSYEQIADVCGLSVGTVSATLSQALDELRQTLGVTEVNP